jgi:hypothetical protein
MGMPGMKKKKYEAIKADLKPIKCAVCELAAHQMYEQQIAKRLLNGKLKGEEEVEQIVENICDPKKEEGKWVASVDLTYDAKLEEVLVVGKGGVGQCKRECQTVAKACSLLMDDIDVDDLQVRFDTVCIILICNI